ncbi:MAG: sterol carrier family protein [Actinomycetota bacterium]|nr:sterol carrier family protein [Actinomycetota bacterium]
MTPAITSALLAIDAGEPAERTVLKQAVKDSLAALVEVAPGHSVEIRIPPFAAVQAIPGARHRRGTPPAVVETDATTWLLLCVGRITWDQASKEGRVHASGERSDLSQWFPLEVA